MVLFTEPVSRRNTFVGGKCAPPSVPLVLTYIRLISMSSLATDNKEYRTVKTS